MKIFIENYDENLTNDQYQLYRYENLQDSELSLCGDSTINELEIYFNKEFINLIQLSSNHSKITL